VPPKDVPNEDIGNERKVKKVIPMKAIAAMLGGAFGYLVLYIAVGTGFLGVDYPTDEWADRTVIIVSVALGSIIGVVVYSRSTRGGFFSYAKSASR
jgi:hypothetical protein